MADVYGAAWPVLDLDVTLSELRDEAQRDLPRLLRRDVLDAVSEPTFRVKEHATGALFLEARVDVVPAARRSGA